MQARNGQIQAGQRQDTARADRTCSAPWQTWQGTAQHLLPWPHSPQLIPSPVRGVPAPAKAPQPQTGAPGFVPPLPGLLPTPQVLGRSPGTQHYPAAHLHSTQPPALTGSPSAKLGKALDHLKTEALAESCSRSPPLAQTLSRAIRLPRNPRHCIPRAPSLRDKNGTGNDTGDRGASGELPRVTTSPPSASVSPLPAAAPAGCGLRALQRVRCTLLDSLPPGNPGLGRDNSERPWQGPPRSPEQQDPRPHLPISFQDCWYRQSGTLGRGGCLGCGTLPPLAGVDRAED